MDILTFQYKRFGRVPINAERKPEHPITVLLHGNAYWVRDSEGIAFLSSQGKYGHRMGDRQNNVNPDVFAKESDDLKEYWTSKTPNIKCLELSSTEVFFLYFIKKWIVVQDNCNSLTSEDLWAVLKSETGLNFVENLVVYCKLREFGWCVRSGLTYGCQYLIYKECPNNYHASAGVFIKSSIMPNHLVSLTRALTNVKKALIMAKVDISSNCQIDTPDDLCKIGVEFVTAKTFFPERIESRETV